MKNNSKQRLFEVMAKVDKSFKPKLNENIDEISTGLADKASNIANDKYFATNDDNPLTKTKRDIQNANFGTYINPELKKFIEKTFSDVPDFKYTKDGGAINLNFPVDINTAPEGVKNIIVSITPIAHFLKTGKIYHGDRIHYEDGGDSRLLPQQHISKLPNVIKKIQADMMGEKSVFNPKRPESTQQPEPVQEPEPVQQISEPEEPKKSSGFLNKIFKK
jgi:hypothetical protein